MTGKLFFSLWPLLLFGCSVAYTAIRRSNLVGNDALTSTTETMKLDSEDSMPSCCILNSWAYEHMDEVRQFANRVRQLFNAISHGNQVPENFNEFDAWKDNIIVLTGKSTRDLDALSVYWANKLFSDMRHGFISYSTIAKPNFFEFKAAEVLKTYGESNVEKSFNFQESVFDVGSYQPIDLTDFDEVKNYAYPAEVKVVNGKTYIVRKNCTEATKTMGDGTISSPLITVLKRNRTIVTTGGSAFPSNNNYFSQGQTNNLASLTRKTNIYDWVSSNMEPSVVDYHPTVSIGTEWSNYDISRNLTHTPISVVSYRPESTVTVHRYNKTVIRNTNGTDSVSGSELKRKWVDGRLVYDELRPFGEQTLSRDEAWKREERERLFWFLNNDSTFSSLEQWQRTQEERLLSMAQRYHITVQNIEQWHQKELERFKHLIKQYDDGIGYLDKMNWKEKERGRFDWLVHQNSMTREYLRRWQRENQSRLEHLARIYGISLDELNLWQDKELERLYSVFGKQNQSMIPSGSLQTSITPEQARLDALIREHNATITQLQNSIQLDQKKLTEIRQNYHGNVKDMENWLKSELERLNSIISEQRSELNRITEWQNSERERLESLLRAHRGSIAELEAQMAHDRNYMQSLAAKYHISIEELEKWQKSELERLQYESKTQLEQNVKEWQAKEHENLMSIISRNDLTIDDFKSKIINDRARLEALANTYKVQVSEVEDWFRQELKNFKEQGILKEVEKELTTWQQRERQHLFKIVQENTLSMEDLEQKFKNDQEQLYSLANSYQIRVEELEDWLKKEFLRLQEQGLVKAQDLKDWQRAERDHIMQLVKQNTLTIEEFEQKLLKDRERLQKLSRNYNIQRSELEIWLREECKRLQELGLLKMQEQLNQWQQIERQRLLSLIKNNNLNLEQLEAQINQDQTHLYSLAQQHQVRVEEIEAWVKNEIKKLQQQGLLEIEKLKDWQSQWRGNLTNMLQERDFTVEEFHKWLLDDRSRLKSLAKLQNVQIEELEQWVKNEEDRFVGLGLLKPNEKLTNWQQVERRYLERITQEQQYRSTEQLEQRLRQDRELLEQLAREYSIQVEDIQNWMKKELARLRNEGQLQIDNLTAWQLAERERLAELTKARKEWDLTDLEVALKTDREYMQRLAFQYHTSIEEIEKWLKTEILRLEQLGKIEIKNLTSWQRAEQERILHLLANQSSITAGEFQKKVEQDKSFLQNLANEYHISVMDIEAYVQKVIENLKQKGKFEVQNLQSWQLVERDYIKQLIMQYDNELSTADLAKRLTEDRAHMQQLAAQYRINVEQIEKWMLEELNRLRSSSEKNLKQLSTWQESEVKRLKDLLQKNQQIDYVSFEMELMKERQRLKTLSEQYAVSISEIEAWLRQQLLNLKTDSELQVQNLSEWQANEQNRLIVLLLEQQENQVSYADFETQLQANQTRLQQLAQRYSISVQEIENWMRAELKRLQSSGLVQVQHLNSWQQAEKNRLEQWLRQLNNNVSFTELLEFLRRDEHRLKEIANEYQITVEEVERWIEQEAARLQLLNIIRQPSYQNEYNTDALWKLHTRGHLYSSVQAKPMTWQNFEEYLKRERIRWQHFAIEYNITVEEIEQWLRQCALDLQQQGLIQDSLINVETWQINEHYYIQELVNTALRKSREHWTLEELQTWLEEDKQRLQQISKDYQVSIENILAWYREELQHLFNQRKITKALISDWRQRERVRIYGVIHSHRLHMRKLQLIQALLLDNQYKLRSISKNYHVTIEELIDGIKKELQRLSNLGILNANDTQIVYNNWHLKEKQRLRTIATELLITERELLDFIAEDHTFQQKLSQHYGCSLDQLAPFQRIEISLMQKEKLFEIINLISFTPWQWKEREQLYRLIKNQNFTLKNLRDLQRQDNYINALAAKYGIDSITLKNWQFEEFERLIKLANRFRMSLYQLQEFREKELLRINNVMHKTLSTFEEREQCQRNEFKHIQELQRLYGLSGVELQRWRRKLYLLCQGLIPFEFGDGGYDTGIGATNVTALPEQKISKDRGDQPPHIYEENLDSQEPGLEGQEPLYHNLPDKIISISTTHTPHIYLTSTAPVSGIQSGYHYTKQEYKFTSAPVGMATASATSDSYRSSASASIITPGHLHGRRQSGQNNEYQNDMLQNYQKQVSQQSSNIGQQIQEEDQYYPQSEPFQRSENFEDFGEHQTQDWKQHEKSYGIEGQQQQQLEDYLQQQQIGLEDFKHYTDRVTTYHLQETTPLPAATIVNAEPVSESQNTGFWSNLKKKTADIFG